MDDIRKLYERHWDSKVVQEQQMGVALYFIDQLALRAGHEKDEDEADTVGCCTLQVCPPPGPPGLLTYPCLLRHAEADTIGCCSFSVCSQPRYLLCLPTQQADSIIFMEDLLAMGKWFPFDSLMSHIWLPACTLKQKTE